MSSISTESNRNQANYYIFLDIDGVLFSSQNRIDADEHPSQEAFDYANAQEDYLKKNTNSYSNNYWSIVYAHHFSKKAVGHLMQFIQRVEQVATARIVITSKWRKDRTPEELRTIYFKMHPFAPYIVDKIPDQISDMPFATRAEEIQYWINQSSPLEYFVIFDDEDLKKKFGPRFILVHPYNLLSENDIESAIKNDSSLLNSHPTTVYDKV